MKRRSRTASCRRNSAALAALASSPRRFWICWRSILRCRINPPVLARKPSSRSPAGRAISSSRLSDTAWRWALMCANAASASSTVLSARKSISGRCSRQAFVCASFSLGDRCGAALRGRAERTSHSRRLTKRRAKRWRPSAPLARACHSSSSLNSRSVSIFVIANSIASATSLRASRSEMRASWRLFWRASRLWVWASSIRSRQEHPQRPEARGLGLGALAQLPAEAFVDLGREALVHCDPGDEAVHSHALVIEALPEPGWDLAPVDLQRDELRGRFDRELHRQSSAVRLVSSTTASFSVEGRALYSPDAARMIL